MAELTAELDLEIAKFKQALKTATTSTQRFKAGSKKTGAGLGGALFGGLKKAATGVASAVKSSLKVISGAGLAATAALTAGVKVALDLGGRMSDVGSQISSTAGQARILETAFRQAGLSVEKMPSTINKMSRSILDAAERGGTLLEPFENLGLNPEDLIEGDPTEVFQTIGAALTTIEDPVERAGRAMQIFGRSGAEVLRLFEDGDAIENARTSVGGAAAILDESADEMDRAADILDGMGTKISGFFVGVAGQIIDNILPVLELIESIDLAPIGARLGKALSEAIQFLTAAIQELSSGDLLNLTKAALILAFKESVNFLYRTMIATIRATGTLIVESFATAIQVFKMMTQKDFWSGMWSAILGLANTFRAILLETIADILEAANKIPGVNLVTDETKEALREAAQGFRDDAAVDFSDAGDALSGPVDQLMDRLAQQFQTVGESFTQGFSDAGDVLDATEETGALLDAFKQIQDRVEKNKSEAEGKEKKDDSPERAAGAGAALGPSGGGKQLSGLGAIAGGISLLTGGQSQELVANETRKNGETLKNIEGHLADMKQGGPTKPAQAQSRGVGTPVFA